MHWTSLYRALPRHQTKGSLPHLGPAPPRHQTWILPAPTPLLVTSGGNHRRLVQTCSLKEYLSPPVLTSGGHWSIYIWQAGSTHHTGMLSCLDSASSVRSGRSTHWHPPVVCFLILIWIFDNIDVEVWLWCGNNFQRIEIIMKLRLSSFTLTISDGIREKLLKITKINVHKDCLECHRLEFVKKNSFFFDIACRSGFDRVEKKMTTQFVYSKWWLFLSRLHCKNIF